MAMTPLIKTDLNLYLKMIDLAKERFGASDTAEHNHGLLNKMAWEAIVRHHAPVCPKCGDAVLNEPGLCKNCV